MYHLPCPHCGLYVQIHPRDVRCGIFRHGVMKGTWQQVPPHAPKSVCDALYQRGMIYGCGRPFRFAPGPALVPCDYI